MIPGVVLVLVAAMAAQLSPRMSSLVAAVQPLLPYPDANADGDLPANNSADAKWFVLWPSSPDDTRIIVRANPLHPDVQKATAEAMEAINAAVTAAERRAQDAYDRALAQLKATGKAGALENVSLDDEGIAGERIDAELEVTIELLAPASFELESGESPVVTQGSGALTWVVTVPANSYRSTSDQREHFRAAETHVYFGVSARPAVAQVGNAPRYRVTLTPGTDAFGVVIRGSAEVVTALATGTDWRQLSPR